jgi:hypothetical protein
MCKKFTPAVRRCPANGSREPSRANVPHQNFKVRFAQS